MALLSRPKLLVLDEPTTSLDATIEAGIIDLVGVLQRRHGMAVLYVSHNLGLIRQTCRRLVVMYAGQAIETGDTERLLVRPRHPYTAGLLACLPRPNSHKQRNPLHPIVGQLPPPHALPPACRFAPRCAFASPGRCDTLAPSLVESDAGSVRCIRATEIDLSIPPPSPEEPNYPTTNDVVIAARGVRKTFALPIRGFAELFRRRRLTANDGVDIVARHGETVAVVGESGSGKTTLARLIAGLDTASTGEIVVLGEDVARTPVADRRAALRSTLQMVFQDPNDTLNPSHSVARQISRAIRKLGSPTLTASARRAEVARLLSLVRLPPDVASRLPDQLSGGQRQRVSIARALAGSPQVLLADEPASALDVSVQAAVIDLLLDVQRRAGTTLVYISHDLAMVRYLADRVYVMYRGRVVESGPVGALFAPPYHPYTEALLSAIPSVDGPSDQRIVLSPAGQAPGRGCPFAPRCPRRTGEICDTTPPPVQCPEGDHMFSCHLTPDDLGRRQAMPSREGR